MNSSAAVTITYNGVSSVGGLELYVLPIPPERGLRYLRWQRLEDSDPAKISVGSSDNLKVWHLPKKLLVKHSTFFAAALDSNFAEGRTQCVTLPEEDPNLFRVLVDWLYRGSALGEVLSTTFRSFLDDYIRAWALGDRLGCSKFQDTAMLEIISYHVDERIFPDTMILIYELTAPRSLLRKFAIDQFRWDYSTEHLCGQEESFFDLGAVMREVKDDYWYAITHPPDDGEKDPANLKGRYLEDPKFRVRWD